MNQSMGGDTFFLNFGPTDVLAGVTRAVDVEMRCAAYLVRVRLPLCLAKSDLRPTLACAGVRMAEMPPIAIAKEKAGVRGLPGLELDTELAIVELPRVALVVGQYLTMQFQNVGVQAWNLWGSVECEEIIHYR